jgi:hypothetical protein
MAARRDRTLPEAVSDLAAEWDGTRNPILHVAAGRLRETLGQRRPPSNDPDLLAALDVLGRVSAAWDRFIEADDFDSMPSVILEVREFLAVQDEALS